MTDCKGEVYVDTCGCLRPKDSPRALASHYKSGRLAGELIEKKFGVCPCGCGHLFEIVEEDVG